VQVNKESLLRPRTKEQVQAFIDAHTEVQRWLRKIPSPLTKNEYAHDLIRYVEATGLSPAQLIALKQKVGHEAEDLLDEFVEKAEQVGIGNARIWSLSRAVKSFYKWNYADLSRGAGKKTLIKKKPYRTPDKESLLQFMDGANLRDKALIHFIASTGISEGSLPFLKWSHVWHDLIEKPVSPPHIGLTSAEIKGRGAEKYAGVEQHTFLTPSAVQALMKYKDWRERVKGEKITPESPLFATVEGPLKALTVSAIRIVFSETSKRTGITFSPHDFRRFVQTQLEFARMQPNWIKKILRHKVKGEENPYSQPKIEQLRSAYREATPYLDLGVTPLSEIMKRQEVVEALTNKLMRGEPFNEQDKENIGRYHIMLTQEEIPKELAKKGKKTQTNGGTDCGEEFEQIKEEQLLGYLRSGWQVVKGLKNGEVIVKR
jgi:integrase